MFEVDGQTDDALKAMAALGEVIRDTLRECDAVCALGSNRAAAVLEGTAEQGAVWVSERVRHNLRAHPIGRSISVATGIASYPMHALGAPELVTLATEALQNARRRGSDSVEIAAID
jgi:diguanylate cyclase (GGDEF)-like protein